MKNALIMTALGLFLTASVLASPKPSEQATQNKEIKQDIKEMRSTEKSLKQLDHEINLWHDANLKGDKALINQFEVLIFDHLEKDIQATLKQIERYESELEEANFELYGPQPSRSAKVDDRQDFNDDKYDVQAAKSLLKAKKHIFRSLRRSRTFSNQYRLLGDYAALLKKELGLGNIELAEDIGEYQER